MLYSNGLEAFVASPSGGKRPLVILCHAFRGRDEFICEKAKEVASWGYVGFALDMYGKGVIGKSKEECLALKKPFMDDRALLQRRVVEGYNAAIALPNVDASRVVAVGLGFGGICALDLARSEVALKGVVSIYGHFTSPLPNSAIKAKVLILHGYDDKIADQKELLTFEKELNEANVDWQALVFGHTMHAFATPTANDPGSGLLYKELSAKRAWAAVRNFLDENFQPSV